MTDMHDAILESWLETQHREGLALAGASDVLTLVPVPRGAGAPEDYLARFDARSLVRRRGTVVEVEGFAVGVHFPPEYLRVTVDPARVVTLFSPEVFHPNVRLPFICSGRLPPGTGLCELLQQVYEILTFQRVTPREDDALNAEACAWARGNLARFPIDPRPLKRRTLEIEVAPLDGGAA
jgi:hypothetical protein